MIFRALYFDHVTQLSGRYSAGSHPERLQCRVQSRSCSSRKPLHVKSNRSARGFRGRLMHPGMPLVWVLFVACLPSLSLSVNHLGHLGALVGCRVLGASLGAVVDGGACFVVGRWSARALRGAVVGVVCLVGGWSVCTLLVGAIGRLWCRCFLVCVGGCWFLACVALSSVCRVVRCRSLSFFFFFFSFSNGVWSASGRCLVRWRRRLACATCLSPVGTS